MESLWSIGCHLTSSVPLAGGISFGWAAGHLDKECDAKGLSKKGGKEKAIHHEQREKCA